MTTTIRRAMLDILEGKPPERPLFVPRLDIWYNRNRARGTLPPGFADLALAAVAARLGVGMHAVIPDFIRGASAAEVMHRGLGFYNHPDFPYRADFSAVEVAVERSAEGMRVTYRGSGGEISTAFAYGPALMASGASIPEITERAIKRPEDYPVLAEILSRVRIVPTPEGYRRRRAEVGESGLAVAYISLAAGPMQHVMRDLRRYEDFCFDQHDEPERLGALIEVLAGLYDGMLAAAAASDAELVLFGANYDDGITPPRFFDRHLAPWLDRACARLHPLGKRVLTHTDGENRCLLASYARCRFDVADSVCPHPMTRVGLAEYRRRLPSGVTIWGGIPSNILLASCCGDGDFRAHIAQLLAESRPYDRLILSIADTTPPDADFDRIRHIIDRCAAVRSSG